MGDEPSDAKRGETVLALPADPRAPGLARDYVRENAGYLPPSLLDDALVLVSELVTNAVQHGRPDIELRLRETPPGIGVFVADAGDGQPRVVPSPPDEHETHGRGLRIVEALASDWGVNQADSRAGKVVWFELRPEPG